MAKKKITKKKFKYFQELFLEQRKKILSVNRNYEIDVDGDEIDLVQGILLHSMEEKMSQRDKFKLVNIEQALKRLEDGLFGDCNECGEPIPELRLIARPECTTCISCAEELEKTSRDYYLNNT
jgi:DnaK suppressor protein